MGPGRAGRASAPLPPRRGRLAGGGDLGKARGGGGGARLRRARVVHPAEPGAPRAATAPAPTRVRARGVGTGRVAGCGAAGEWGIGRSPQPREVLEVRGMGRNPAIGLYRRSALLLLPPPQMRPSRGPGFRSSLRPQFWPGPCFFSPQGRACPPLPQTGFSALLGSVGTSRLNSPFLFFFFRGFILRGRQRGRWLSSSPPRPRAHQVSCPKAGLGAPSGRKWGRVHPRGGACGRGALVSRACRSGLRPSPCVLLAP